MQTEWCCIEQHWNSYQHDQKGNLLRWESIYMKNSHLFHDGTFSWFTSTFIENEKEQNIQVRGTGKNMVEIWEKITWTVLPDRIDMLCSLSWAEQLAGYARLHHQHSPQLSWKRFDNGLIKIILRGHFYTNPAIIADVLLCIFACPSGVAFRSFY